MPDPRGANPMLLLRTKDPDPPGERVVIHGWERDELPDLDHQLEATGRTRMALAPTLATAWRMMDADQADALVVPRRIKPELRKRTRPRWTLKPLGANVRWAALLDETIWAGGRVHAEARATAEAEIRRILPEEDHARALADLVLVRVGLTCPPGALERAWIALDIELGAGASKWV